MWNMLARARGRLSFHMPGAQGKAPFGGWNPYRLDTTELAVTDDLYRPTGAIARAQALAAKSAGAAHTFMLAGGSTAGVHAMLLYAAGRGDAVILPRNVHVSALNLCAVAGLEPVFARPAYTAQGRAYTSLAAYEEAMERCPRAKAVLVTRPDYAGLMPDLSGIAEAAHRRGLLALCDEAHGATFNWRGKVGNAGARGADLFVQSAHKTLPALTSGAWLHAGPGMDAERLVRVLRMVQTSSPSFLTLLSLDDARAWMDRFGPQACHRLEEAVGGFFQRVARLGYGRGQDDAPAGCSYDPLRIVLRGPQGGLALEAALRGRGIDVEMSDEGCVVLIPSLMDGAKRLKRLEKALGQMAGAAERRREGDAQKSPPSGKQVFPPENLPERVAPLSQAAFARSQAVPLEEAAGRVSAAQVGLYPPGVALVTAGERIEAPLVAYLRQADPARVFGWPEPGTLLCLTRDG